MGMPVMKEVEAQWLIVLYDKLHKRSTDVNRFKNTGIVEAVQNAREHPLIDEEVANSGSCVPPELDEDPFDSCMEAEDS